jgi:hypothetical protein
MENHSRIKVSLATLLLNRPLMGITYVSAPIVIHSLGGNLVDFACVLESCKRTVEVVDGVLFCNNCQKELNESEVELKSRPLADITVGEQKLFACTIAAGNEMAVFGFSCDAIYEGAEVEEITDVKFDCSVGVAKDRVILTKLRRSVQ